MPYRIVTKLISKLHCVFFSEDDHDKRHVTPCLDMSEHDIDPIPCKLGIDSKRTTTKADPQSIPNKMLEVAIGTSRYHEQKNFLLKTTTH